MWKPIVQTRGKITIEFDDIFYGNSSFGRYPISEDSLELSSGIVYSLPNNDTYKEWTAKFAKNPNTIAKGFWSNLKPGDKYEAKLVNNKFEIIK